MYIHSKIRFSCAIVDYDSKPHGAIRVLPLVKELGGFGHTGSIVPNTGKQQQVTSQHSLRHGAGVIPFLLVNQILEQIYNIALKNKKRH